MPVPKEGEVLLKSTYISVDPYMRGKMKGGKSYSANFETGKPLYGYVAAEVVESKHPDFKTGDTIRGGLPWFKYVAVPAKMVQKIDTSIIPVEKHMSSANYSGLSSYLPIKYIGDPKEGEVAFVSGGAGAVGSCACQILKALGCKVVSCAGSNEKVEWLQRLGIQAFNYKEGKFSESLRKACPEGINIYFDNVGGPILDAVLPQMKDFGRVIMCGMISQYNKKPEELYGIKNLMHAITKRLKMQGYIVTDFDVEKTKAAASQLIEWIRSGDLKTTETIIEGFEKIPEAFMGLFTGKNVGKMLVKIA